MIAIALCRRLSNIFVRLEMARKEQGIADRGWQDKSADGCRAHVVGRTRVFVTLDRQQAGSFFERANDINGSSASPRSEAMRSREPAR
jgi:hypothetical protein